MSLIPAAFRTSIVMAQETKFSSGDPYGSQYAQDGLLSLSFNKEGEQFTSTSIYGTTDEKDYINTTGNISLDFELTSGKFLNQLLYWLFGARGSVVVGDFEDSSYDINFYGNFPSFITEVTMPDNYISYRLNGCIVESFRVGITANSPIITCSFNAKFCWMQQDIPIPRTDLIEERRLPSQPFRTAVYVSDPSPTLSFDRSHWKEMATEVELSLVREIEYKAFDYHGRAKSFSINRTSVGGRYQAYGKEMQPFDFLDNDERSVLFSSGASDSSGSLNFFFPSVKFRNPNVNPYHSGLVSYSIPFDSLPKYGSGKILELRARLPLLPPDAEFADAEVNVEIDVTSEISPMEITADTEIWIVYDSSSLPSDFIDTVTAMVDDQLKTSLTSIYGSEAAFDSKTTIVGTGDERYLQWLRSNGGSGPSFGSNALVIGLCDESTPYYAGSVPNPLTGSPNTPEFIQDRDDLVSWLSSLTTEKVVGILFPSDKTSFQHEAVVAYFEYLNDNYVPLDSYPEIRFESPISLIQPKQYYFDKIRDTLANMGINIPDA